MGGEAGVRTSPPTSCRLRFPPASWRLISRFNVPQSMTRRREITDQELRDYRVANPMATLGIMAMHFNLAKAHLSTRLEELGLSLKPHSLDRPTAIATRISGPPPLINSGMPSQVSPPRQWIPPPPSISSPPGDLAWDLLIRYRGNENHQMWSSPWDMIRQFIAESDRVPSLEAAVKSAQECLINAEARNRWWEANLAARVREEVNSLRPKLREEIAASYEQRLKDMSAELRLSKAEADSAEAALSRARSRLLDANYDRRQSREAACLLFDDNARLRRRCELEKARGDLALAGWLGRESLPYTTDGFEGLLRRHLELAIERCREELRTQLRPKGGDPLRTLVTEIMGSRKWVVTIDPEALEGSRLVRPEPKSL